MITFNLNIEREQRFEVRKETKHAYLNGFLQYGSNVILQIEF